jgi:hypothetical protein
MFGTKQRSKNAKLFDVQGIHPNIRSSLGTKVDLLKMWNYLRKEGFTNFGTWEGPGTQRCVTVNKNKNKHTYLFIVKSHPSKMVMQMPSLQKQRRTSSRRSWNLTPSHT